MISLLLSGAAFVGVTYAQDVTIADDTVDDDTVDKVLFEADAVSRETADSPIIATGNVKAWFGTRYLESDSVIYNPTTDIVIARGNVAITDAEGETFFADEVQLDGDLHDGVASNFGALLSDKSRLAGSTVIKSSDGRNELNHAAYSACDVCKENGDAKTPSWQVKARRVVQDPDQNVIRFNDATVEVLGVPVFYTPWMQIPDPSVERQSGLLTPKIGSSSTLGTYLELPYYFAISNSQDLTLSPKFMSQRGFLPQLEYRRRTNGGAYAIQTGIIGTDGLEEQDVSGNPRTFPVPEIRYHVFAKAYQDFAEKWNLDLDVNHISDRRYLRSYNIEPEGDLKRDPGLFRPDRLRSSANVSRRTDDSLLTIETIGFNSLRSDENNDYAGQVLPRVTFTKDFAVPAIGGKATMNANILSLYRKSGLASTRGILAAVWEKAITTGNGHRFKFFSELRGDYYSYQNITDGTETCNITSNTAADPTFYQTCLMTLPEAGTSDSSTTSRFLPTAGIEWSYPLAKRTSNAVYVIEPKIQFVASTKNDFSDNILNEDSQFFEFDSTTLYDWSKGSGYDAWEDGQRLNIGISAVARYDNGLSLSGLIGQQFRAAETTAFITDFNQNPGIADKTSDIVGAVGVKWSNNIDFKSRFRLDAQSGELRNNDSTLTGAYGPFSGSLGYQRTVAGDQSTISERDEYLSTNLQYKLTKNWQIGARRRQDLEAGTTVSEIYSLRYIDECTDISIDYRNDKTRSDSFDFDRSINIRLELRGFNG